MEESKAATIPKGMFEIRRAWCKGCELCIKTCPKGVLALDEAGKVFVHKSEECIGCGMCANICPDYVIRVIEND
jgi:NAD-dependent dihydropyrimidine dehydrogenase PreA subunit